MTFEKEVCILELFVSCLATNGIIENYKSLENISSSDVQELADKDFLNE